MIRFAKKPIGQVMLKAKVTHVILQIKNNDFFELLAQTLSLMKSKAQININDSFLKNMLNFLNEKDQKLFYKIHKNLLLFVNQKTKLSKKFKGLSDWGEYANFANDITALRDHLFKQRELIDEFMEANPAGLDEQELSVTKNWKNAVTGNFVILKHLKNHSIFLNKKNAYGVIGLMESIEEIIPKYYLPIFVDTVLIPFSGKIVYDGLFQTSNVIMGNGYIKSFTEDYNSIKKAGGIITSL
jgi:hypothetical protein